MKYSEALRAAVVGTLTGLVWRATWRDIGHGIIAVLVLTIRVLVFLSLPVSLPILAVLIQKDEALRKKQDAEARRRLREQLHKFVQQHGAAQADESSR